MFLTTDPEVRRRTKKALGNTGRKEGGREGGRKAGRQRGRKGGSYGEKHTE